jgi:hypothetical protein
VSDYKTIKEAMQQLCHLFLPHTERRHAWRSAIISPFMFIKYESDMMKVKVEGFVFSSVPFPE